MRFHFLLAALFLMAIMEPQAMATPKPTVKTTTPAEGYYALNISGKRVGYGHYIRSSAPGSDMKVVSDVLIKLGLLGTPMDMRYQAIADYAPDGVTPKTFAMTLTRGANATTINCLFQHDTVDWTVTAGGSTTHRVIPFPPGTALVHGNLVETWQNVLRHAPASGKAFSVSVFEPLTGETQKMSFTPHPAKNVTVLGKPILCHVWALDDTISFAVEPKTGQILDFDVPSQNAVFHLADKEALKDIQDFDLTSQAFAVARFPVGDPASLHEVKLQVTAKIGGETMTAASLQRPPQQTFQGTVKNNTATGLFTIHAFHYDGAHAARFPYAKSTTSGQQKWLQPDALTESDDPQIKALAKKLTSGSKTGWEAASKIGHWVFQNITYVITGASAKACLNSKQGDCGPHTNLTVALCRAAGIPARMTGGALYSSLLGGSYGQHYWVRVWMGPKDGWIPIDPTSGEIGDIGPTHLNLWNAGGMQSLSVKVVDYAPKTAPVAETPDLPRHANGLSAGYTEKYDFQIDGKPVGTQTATLTQITGDAQHWTYGLSLNVPKGTQIVNVTEDGTMTLTDQAVPQSAAFTVHVSGIVQSLSLDFGKSSVKAIVGTGDSKFPSTVPLTGHEMLGINNNITLWSLALRSVATDDGKPLVLPTFMADSLHPLTLTLTPGAEETLTIGTQSIPCRIYDVAPLGEKFWLEKSTGALIKITEDKQKLVVLRE